MSLVINEGGKIQVLEHFLLKQVASHFCIWFGFLHEVCRMEASLQADLLDTTITKPNIEGSGWLYQTKTHNTHIVYQPFSRVMPCLGFASVHLIKYKLYLLPCW